MLDDRTLAYPEYRGNGVHASLGNISENGHVGLLMVDFVHDLIGLHVNGAARIVATTRSSPPSIPRCRSSTTSADGARSAGSWSRSTRPTSTAASTSPGWQRVHERRDWGTDDPGRKGGDYFGVRGTPARVPSPRRGRRPFPSTTHLAGGAAHALRRRS